MKKHIVSVADILEDSLESLNGDKVPFLNA